MVGLKTYQHPCNIVLRSAPRSSKWCVTIGSFHKNPVCTCPAPIRTTCPAHPICLDLITRIIFGEEYRAEIVTRMERKPPCFSSLFFTFYCRKFLFLDLLLIHQLRLLGSHQYPQGGVLLTSFSTWVTENSLADIKLESAGGDKGL